MEKRNATAAVIGAGDYIGGEIAKKFAAEQIDRMGNSTATAEEQASRKQRLLKGPEEFREARVDRPKAKPKG